MSNYVQGAKTAAGVFTPSFVTLAAGSFAIGTAIDLTAVVPFEVLFEVTAGIASAPVSTVLTVDLYLQYSLDGTNWSSFLPATIVGTTQMEYIGSLPVPDQNGTKTKVFTSQGNPTCRWIRPVVYNGTGVVLSNGTMNYAVITGS
jgi:hypothetical protein